VLASTLTAGAQASDLTISSTAISGSKVNAKIAGGVDGATYQIEFTAVTTNGYTLCGIGYLFVDDR
jgi:hypothetical protein